MPRSGAPTGSVRLATGAPARVLYVINDLALGGAQRVAFHQSSYLDRARFEPAVASFEFIADGELIPDFERAGIPVHRLRSAAESAWRGLLRLDRLIQTFRPDLVHTHLAAAGVLGRLAARRRGVPRVVTTLHNLSDWEEKRVSPLRWLDRRTLGRADVVVTVSQAIRSAVARVTPELAARTVTVHNGVPIERMRGARNERDASRAALGYTESEFVVGSVARFDPRKGLETLLEAIARLGSSHPEVRILLVGDGPERPRLEAQARRLGITSRVRLETHHADVRSMLAAMDLFAAPSRTEGLGMAIIEALAAGIPVIGSRVGGIPEVVEDGTCGRLLPVGDAERWAETISALAQRPPELARWQHAAPSVAARFSLEKSGAEIERLYDRVLGRSAPGVSTERLHEQAA